MSHVQRAATWLKGYCDNGMSWTALCAELEGVVPEPARRALLVSATQAILEFGTDSVGVRAPLVDAFMRFTYSFPEHTITHSDDVLCLHG